MPNEKQTFFGTCHKFAIERSNLKDELWVELLGYSGDDDIKVTLPNIYTTFSFVYLEQQIST